MSKLMPKYTLMEAVHTAISLGLRALEEIRTLARLPGPEGPAGEDGLGFDDMDLVYDGERTFTFQWVRGNNVVKRAFTLPIMIDRGVYKDGEPYAKGDCITFQGSFYIAQKDTEAKPHTPEARNDWRLAVKRGADGKDGKDANSAPLPSVKIKP